MRESMTFRADWRDITKDFPDKYFDLASCDPPYFDGPQKRKFYGTAISKRNVKRVDYPIIESWDIPQSDYAEEMLRISKKQVIWGINYYSHLFSGSGRLVWDKCNGSSSYSDAEIAYVSCHDSVRLFRFMWNGMNQGKSLSEGHIMQGDKTKNETRIHTNQKPVILYDYINSNYVPEGGKVFDSHLGSGSNRISSHKMQNIDFYGCEKDLTQFKRQEKRWKEYSSQLQLFHF